MIKPKSLRRERRRKSLYCFLAFKRIKPVTTEGPSFTSFRFFSSSYFCESLLFVVENPEGPLRRQQRLGTTEKKTIYLQSKKILLDFELLGGRLLGSTIRQIPVVSTSIIFSVRKTVHSLH
eukprot:gene12190-8389_t